MLKPYVTAVPHTIRSYVDHISDDPATPEVQWSSSVENALRDGGLSRLPASFLFILHNSHVTKTGKVLGISFHILAENESVIYI